jgi:general secretion pathway protein F
MTNAVMANAVDEVTTRVKEGSSLSEPLSRTRVFPKLAVQLTRIGEATGRLDEMLAKQADILDEEVQTKVKRLLALLVPAITIVMGGFVAAIIASVLVALLGANDLVG